MLDIIDLEPADTNVNTKELIVSELESTSEDLLSEVLQFVKSQKC